VAAANLASRGSVSPELAGTAAILASLASAVVNIPVIAKQARSSSVTARVTAITVFQMAAGLAAILIQHFLMKISW
jgi:uncharacterized membrane protein (DUF4010 family)